MKTLTHAIVCALVAATPTLARADAPAITQAAAASTSTPVLAWNRIALDAVERAKPTQHQAIRLLTYVSLAQYAVLAAAEGGQTPRASVATESMRVITELMPSQAAFVEERHRQQPAAAAGQARQMAPVVLAQARQDGFAQTWSGQVPQGAYGWRSLANPPAPPAYPVIGAMRLFFVESGHPFRSAPPPPPGSALFLADLAEVQKHTANPTADTTRVAKFYDMTSGSLVAVSAEPKLHLFGRYENDAISANTRFSFYSEWPSLRRLIRPEACGF